jgi:transposase
MRRDRYDLFRFITRRDVPYTNNTCEQALRPSVIFRKVTYCLRAEWGARSTPRPRAWSQPGNCMGVLR